MQPGNPEPEVVGLFTRSVSWPLGCRFPARSGQLGERSSKVGEVAVVVRRHNDYVSERGRQLLQLTRGGGA
jgi:hypothetical protein